VRDALRLAFGTLTVLPVRAPENADRRTAGRAMVLAPLVGLLVALVVAGAAVVARLVVDGAPGLLVGALVVGLLAVLTRCIHLDGLADTADGLGSGARAEQALAIMRKSDIGPFGVVTLVLVLVIQVAAVAELASRHTGFVELATALVASRLLLPLLCTARVPAARADGLGSMVAGSVGPAGVLVAIVLGAVAVVLAMLVDAGLGGSGVGAVQTVLIGALSLMAGGLLCLRCVHRLGGVTGDVLGACVETAYTTGVVVACL
jgi:adenosylcobinamide-GDP ribazoletransferase